MARQSAAQPAPSWQARARRDTLDVTDQAFLRDQLRALLASPALARVAHRPPSGPDDGDNGTNIDPAVASELESARDTEPTLETRLLREALRAGLK